MWDWESPSKSHLHESSDQLFDHIIRKTQEMKEWIMDLWGEVTSKKVQGRFVSDSVGGPCLDNGTTQQGRLYVSDARAWVTANQEPRCEQLFALNLKCTRSDLVFLTISEAISYGVRREDQRRGNLLERDGEQSANEFYPVCACMTVWQQVKEAVGQAGQKPFQLFSLDWEGCE